MHRFTPILKEAIRLLPHSLMALALAIFVLLAATDSRAADTRGAEYFTNLPLVTSEGEEVAFFDDMLKDKIVVVNFFYTECTDYCSLTTARLAQVYEWLGERMGRDIFFVSITLDPERDTPEKLHAFKQGFNADKGWTFLTGTRENIDAIRFKLGEKARALNLHRTDMVIGNAKTGVWRRSSVMGSLTIALQSILELDPDHNESAQTNAEALQAALKINTVYDLSAHPGEAIFLSACASCHTIGYGERYAPDLAAVTLRREEDWLKAFIMNPDLVLKSGDPIAEVLNADYPGVVMPNLGLNPVDVEDLLSYLKAADARLAMSEEEAAASFEAFEKAHGLAE
ncbi:SCO1/SenC/PrrC family cytochrome c oxidase assembly protein [Tabrizicola sp. TH137]|uniref:SCO family protein n=1 Tax=Tabrizicola sp. TH137 TaxID=2067452 RepID=UPI000C7CEDAA|nr:SCO family protein [Tabrizicola sp. TH137]PLL10560.1 SCO1/SenC/PrrC family cytochrome c oxidase assembly protein [Tabrizicola sp. TH137]